VYQIIASTKRKKYSKNFDCFNEAYAVIFIDYQDVDGEYALAKYYIEVEGWGIIELEKEYYVINSKDEIAEDYIKYYEEVRENGYSLIFNTYRSEKE